MAVADVPETNGDEDDLGYTVPATPSELRLNNFAAVAFGAKQLVGFTYNTGASSFFRMALVPFESV